MRTHIRQALRILRREPGFALLAVLTLAFGIGANTAIFSVVNGILLRSLPYEEAGRLVSVEEVVPKFSFLASSLPVSPRHFAEWRKQSQSLEAVAILENLAPTLSGDGDPEQITGARVTAGYFEALRIRPLAGRLFRSDEEAAGHEVAVLSYSLWQRRFHGDPGIVGRTIRLDRKAHEVIGILPAEPLPLAPGSVQKFLDTGKAPEIWKPFGERPEEYPPLGDFNSAAIARLKPGVSLHQAAAEMSSLADSVARQEVPDANLSVKLTPLQDQVASTSRQGLLLVMAAVGMVLLIACVNLANLLLARALNRRREVAIRSTLGASRADLVWQMFAESMLLAGSGGLGGMLLARWALQAILVFSPLQLPRMTEIRIDEWTLAFAFVLSLSTGVLCGILPAWRFSSADPQEALKAGSRTLTEGRRGGSLRRLLVASEVGLSALCLVAAGLLLHSFVRLMRVDQGFNMERVLTADISLRGEAYSQGPDRTRFYRQMLENLRSLPGTAAAGISNKLPLRGGGSNNLLLAEGTKVPLLERPLADFRFVNPDFFSALGVPLLRGRVFAEADGDRKLAVVSARVAARLWPGQDALGKRFRMGDEKKPLLEVIGIVGDVRGYGPEKEAGLAVYTPYWQDNRTSMSLAVRTSMDPHSSAAAIRQEIRKLDSEVALAGVSTMHELMSAATAQRRFQLGLVGLFAVVALLLSSMGIYGVVAYTVAQRRNEIGIRLALGAEPRAMRWMLLRQGMVPVLAGLAAGLAGALALARWMQSLLFGVSAADPWTYSGVALLLSGLAAIACLGPALKAGSTDPAITLRYE